MPAALGREQLAALLAAALGEREHAIDGLRRIGGGETFAATCGGRRYFLKLDAEPQRLAAEADGLAALARCTAIRVPRVLGLGRADEGLGLLVLEYLELDRAGDPARLGHAVAMLHAITGPAYGWPRDNYIGATPQANGACADWAQFVRVRRLQPQLERARRRGAADLGERAQAVLEALPDIFADAEPKPSLLHGDLWHGNAGFVAGQPALFDPAVHYGDGEADLAMAELFGGFGTPFFTAYAQLRPPAGGPRRQIYALYHVLNHYNLFGGAYAEQARHIIEALRHGLASR